MANAAEIIWSTILEDVTRLKIRVSSSNNLESLEKLCLAKIAEKIEIYCKAMGDSPELISDLVEAHIKLRYQEYLEGKICLQELGNGFETFCHRTQDPFKNLPILGDQYDSITKLLKPMPLPGNKKGAPVLMLSLQKFLQGKDLMFSPRVLPCLVSSNTERLEVNTFASAWSQQDFDALLTRIQLKGTSILELVLNLESGSGRAEPSLEQLSATLQSLGSNLTVLALEYDHLDDSVLATLGSSCPELRKLSLSSNEVTDAGIGLLYISDGTHGKCKKLTHLSVSCCYSLTVDGLVTALENLPELVHLDSGDTYEAIFKYAETGNNKSQLELQYLAIDDPRIMDEDIIINSLAKVVSTVPNIRSLKIEADEIQNIDEFLKLKKLNEIKCSFLKNLSPENLTLLIHNFNHQLTKLEITNYSKELDISVIAYHCTNLIHLIWGSSCTNIFKYKLLPFIYFLKLKVVKLSFYGSLTHTVPLPDIAIKCILAAVSLENLFIEYSYPVNDQVFGWLVNEVRSNEQVFSKLETLGLLCNISFVRAKQIFCIAPKLKKIMVRSEIEAMFRDFLNQHDLKHCKLY